VTRARDPGPAPGASRPSGRRAGHSGTREAILESARAVFAEHGYDRATIRLIAGRAGVDPALVHHYYGSKERLFAAAMQLPVVPSEVLAAALAPGARDPGTPLGEHLVRSALGVWENAALRARFLGLLRSAMTSEQAAAMLREFIAAAILRPIMAAAGAETAQAVAAQAGPAQAGPAQAGPAEAGAAEAGRDPGPDPDPEFRAGLLATQMLGLALCRYLLALPPVAAASPDELAAAIGPVLERYLAGQLGQDPASAPS
jgi:AcrR family transcriptional regulator